MPSNHLILCCPLLLLPSVFPSIRVSSSELALCIRWPKYWSFSFSSSPSDEYSELISFRIDWFHLLAGQGTLKSVIQHYNLKASILFFVCVCVGGRCGAQPSLWSSSYIRTWRPEKPWLWLYRPFVGKVICLLFNTLSRFVSFSSKEHVSFNFMTTVTIHSDFGAQENLSPFPLFPLLLTMKWWD